MIEKCILNRIMRAVLVLMTWGMILAGFIIMSSETASAENYGLYVGGEKFTRDNDTIDKNDNPAFSGKAEFNSSTNTLTLTEFNNGGMAYGTRTRNESYGIYYSGESDLNIVLVGNNTITNGLTDSNTATKSGLYCDSDAVVNITGDSLTIESGDTLPDMYRAYLSGIWVFNKLVIDGCTVISKGGNCKGLGSYGIYVGIDENTDEGILEIKNNGYVKAEGGNITGDNTVAESCGIRTEKAVTITGGTVEATGGSTVNGKSVGVYSRNTATITGGTVKTKGNDIGIYSGGKTTIAGGTVEAVGGSTVNSNSYGIYSENTAAFTGGYVTAKGNTKAIEASFINNDSGFGWTDFEGTQGLSDIPVYTQAGGHNYNYKKIRFPKKYQVTVVNGSGSGFYDADDTVTVTAAAPASGKTFVKWVNDGGISLTDEKAETTTFNMPARDLTVTAEYSDTKKDEKDDREDTLSDKVPPIGNNTYASSKDNFAPVADSGKIKKLVLDFSNVSKSVVRPSDLTMTVIKGSRFKTAAKLKDVKSARSSGGIKVKVNKKTLIPTVKCKSDGTVTLTMDNGVTYTVTFDVQKPKANKAVKKMTVASEGSAPVIRNIKDLFNTDIDSGALKQKKGRHATVSDDVIVIDPIAKDKIKIEYKYINKKYRIPIKIK